MQRVRSAIGWLACAALAACGPGNNAGDASDSGPLPDTNGATTYCELGQPVPGATVPDGFCVRQFAADGVLQPRTLAIAPNGDVFVGSPQTGGAGGSGPGLGAILALSDDNLDGVAEVHTFLSGLTTVHGIALASDTLYFVASNTVQRVPYMPGLRESTTGPANVAAVPNSGRTTHGLAVSAGGTVYVTNAGSGYTCPDPNNGGYIAQVQHDGSLLNVAIGFRNPMYIRCHFHDELCMSTELGDDGGASYDAHEKLFAIQPNTDYGFPCCTGTNAPLNSSTMSCANVTTEEVRFPLNDTPFGLDWERGTWPAPYTNVVCVAKHGSFYSFPSWQGAGVFCAPTDPNTHLPNGNFQLFVDGFGSQHRSALMRPSDVAFSPDGRMFFSDDHGNAVYFVAPTSLRLPGR